MAEARFATVFLTILIAFTVLPVLVRAVDYNVGVKAGDWIKYGQLTVTYSGNGTEPSYVTEEKKLDWIRIDVESVDGTRVLLNMTYHLDNGTQMPQSINADVSGATSMSGYHMLIASNLKEGDAVVDQTSSPTINQTTTGRYAGAGRNVNLLEMTSVFNNQTVTIKYYWDQSTGVMVETYERIPDYSNPGGAYMEFSAKATETNMWGADLLETLYDNLIYVTAGVVALIVVVAAALVLRRKKAQPPPPPPPEPATADTQQQPAAEKPQNNAE